MAADHTLLELRTGRDSEHTPETAVQFLSTLPKLRNNLFYRLLGKTERFSLEILVQNQSIYFLAYVPTRLIEYVSSMFQSSYPEILITKLEEDPLALFGEATDQQKFAQQKAHFISLGNLKLKAAEYFPLKTYLDFKDVDPLASVLSALSKSGPYDTVLVQFLIKDDGDGWKRSGQNSIKGSSGGDNKESSSKHPQKDLIDKKLDSKGLRVAIKLFINSESRDRSDLLIETVSTAFQAISQSEGNSLVLKKPYFFKYHFLQAIKNRSFERGYKQHFNLAELATLFHLPNKNLSSIPNIAWGKTMAGEAPDNLPIVTRDMSPEEKREINPYAKTEYKNQTSVYGIKRKDRRRHMYVIGKTGTGKSTLLANMAINDLKNDEGLCVIDPHGDLVETLLNYIPSRRINDVVYFDPADPDRTVKINLFEGENIVHRELIASGIVSVFQKLYSYSWGPRLEYILRNALLTLLHSPQARLSDILDLLTNPKFRDKVIENLEDPILKNFWVYEFNKMQDRQRIDAIAPILNKVGQFVSSPLVRNVVNAHKSSFSLEDIMDEGKILLVNLSQGKLGEDNATLLGAMLITKIQLAAMARVHTPEETRRDFYLYVDEFQNFATDSFNKILSEARKYRLNLILANQYIAQIPEEVQKAIFGNCGTMMSFVMGAEDSAVFMKEFGEKYSQDDLVSLGRYQVINKLTIDNISSRPFPATTLSLAKSSNNNRDKVIKVSGERYAKKKD